MSFKSRAMAGIRGSQLYRLRARPVAMYVDYGGTVHASIVEAGPDPTWPGIFQHAWGGINSNCEHLATYGYRGP